MNIFTDKYMYQICLVNTKQVGGYSTTYEGNLTLVTVRGAGHEVPSYQPARGLSLVRYFLEGKQLPEN